ncbi:hypothetical protein MtrunA17_Chr8g0391841 [Medicago truncatula]|uniref:Uncharacterized protein n=1 Tax=Medicago truncatula TaxID=3880 RepID=G7LBF0_MEDTR|nr:hypothetical protein MTR_8g105540 [Medicago truncatula]RHN43805.1 hypothetical protein MtrunA17_Chr8g0391841 [Medicago truncatula]
MFRCICTNHLYPRRNQLFPTFSQQSSVVNAPPSGRGRGANHPDSCRSEPSPQISRGGHTVPSSTPTPVAVTASSSTSAQASYHPSVVAPVVAGSSSVSTVPSLSPPPTTVSMEALSSKLTPEMVPEASAPSSQKKVIRFPDRPGFGQEGRKIPVQANHFQLQVANVRIFFSYIKIQS